MPVPVPCDPAFVPRPLIKFPIAAVPFPSPEPVVEFAVGDFELDAFVEDFDEEAAVYFVFFSDFSEVFTVFLELVPVIIFSLADSFLVTSTAFEDSEILV